MTAPWPNKSSRRHDDRESSPIFETASSADLDDITRLAACVCQTPVAFVSLTDGKRQRVESPVGLTKRVAQRYRSVVSRASQQSDALVVRDLLAGVSPAAMPNTQHRECSNRDSHSSDTTSPTDCPISPADAPHPNLRFYAGCTFTGDRNVPLGVLSVMDWEPRSLSPQQLQVLQALGRLAAVNLGMRQMGARSRSQKTADSALKPQAKLRVNMKPPTESKSDPACQKPQRLEALGLSAPLPPLEPAIIVTDGEGRIVDWNPGAEKLYGWSKAEVVGQVANELLQATYSVGEKIAQRLLTDDNWQGVVRHSRRDGTRIHAASHWTVLRNGHDRSTIGCQINYPVLEKKDDFHSQQMGGNVGLPGLLMPPPAIYRLQCSETEYILEFISPGVAEIAGYPDEQLISGFPNTWTSAIHPEDRSRVLQWQQQCRRNASCRRESLADSRENPRTDGGDPYTVDYRIIRADGSVRWVLESAVCNIPIPDLSEGARPWIDGIIFDITDRKQMQESLQDSKTKMVNPLECISDAFFVLDGEGRFTYLNPAAEQIWRHPAGELIGKCIWQEFPESIGSDFERAARRAVAEGVAVDCQTFDAPANRWLSVRTYPNPDGLSVYMREATDSPALSASPPSGDRQLPTQSPPASDPIRESAKERAALERLSSLAATVGIALAQGGPLPDVLDRCAKAVVEHLHACRARVWTYNIAANQLKLEATCGCPTPKEDVPGENSIVNFIASNREPVRGQLRAVRGQLRAISTQAAAKDSHLLPSAQCESPHATDKLTAEGYFAGYPLIVEERLVGVMAAYSDNPLTEDARGLLEWVANSLAIAIDRSRAREALLKRRENLLFRLANQIRNSLDLNTILETAVHEIRNLLQIDRCHFLWYLPHPETPSLMVTHEARSAELPSLLSDCPPSHVNFLAAKIQNMQLLRVDDVEGDPDVDEDARDLLQSLGMTSQLLLPVETRSGQLGAVVCSHCSGPRPWSDSEVELLQAVVNQLAIAIDQAELYAQTHAAALAAQTQAQQLSEALHNLKQTQAQLVQSEKMSSLGQMVAGVAHEINNPVNFIYGNITYAKNYIEDILNLLALYQQHYANPVPALQAELEDIDLEFIIEDLPKILSSMEMGADRIRQIVLSLRNFSRLDEAEKKSVDVHEGIDNTLLILHNRLKPKGNNSGIQIVKEYGDIPPVECYPGQLNQVFMNILSNAIDALENANEPRSIVIRTQLLDKIETSSSYRHWVVIRIRDSGPGMSEKVKQRLFDPFFTTKPVGKGTGLGLSISYQIVVEKHGGLLKCFSELGQGSEFWIQIPLHSHASRSK